MTLRGRTPRPVTERFWEKVDRDGPIPAHRPELGPCWVWTARRNAKGYGTFCLTHRVKGARCILAPRVAYTLAFGFFGPAFRVLHKCDAPPCVRPDHLFLGTVADNNHDMIAKGRYRQGCAPGEAHPFAKLTEAKVIAIRHLRERGATTVELARQFGVHHTTIVRVSNRTQWRRVIG